MRAPTTRAARVAVRVAMALLGAALVGAPIALRAQQASPAARPAAERTADTAAAAERGAPSDSARLARRARRAESAPLFADDGILRLTLVAPLRDLAQSKDTLKPLRAPAVVYVQGANGPARLELTVQPRGHFRLRTCAFAPLRLDFGGGTAGTPFARQDGLKLVTHCRDTDRAEELVLREYLAYRAQALVGPPGHRVRLARVRYVDAREPARADTTRATAERLAFFIEADGDMAARLGGRSPTQRGALFENIAPDSARALALFQYFVGNTDWSLAALHNVRIVVREDGQVLGVPYDYDFSGLVEAGYAFPDARLGLGNTRDRLWRGPCATPAQMAAAAAPFLERRAEVEALWRTPIAGAPALDPGYVRETLAWIGEFYALAGDAGALAKRTRRDNPGCKASN